MAICLFTQAPPLLLDSYGNHGVARNFIQILKNDVSVILTQRLRRSISKGMIKDASMGVDVLIHPSASAFGLQKYLPTICAILDNFIFLIYLPVLRKRLIAQDIDHIFVLFGSDAWLLPRVWLIQRLKIPTTLYLVDDIEESSNSWPTRNLKFLILPLLRSVLKKSARNFAISRGFAESISNEFKTTAEWLPLPAPEFAPRTGKFVPNIENIRHIVFIGAINRLYEDSLRDLYEEICVLNANHMVGYSLVLEIISYANTTSFIGSLPNRDWVVSYERLTDADLQIHLSRAYACFLPYSFAASEKKMVSTSFSCKILEYFKCQRPIQVYGPEYASIPRYFKDLHLPLCATSREELQQELRLIESFDTLELTQNYYAAWEQFHSPAAIRSILLGLSVPLAVQ